MADAELTTISAEDHLSIYTRLQQLDEHTTNFNIMLRRILLKICSVRLKELHLHASNSLIIAAETYSWSRVELQY